MVDENIAITRGFNMAFGVLSAPIIKHFGNELFTTLMQNSIPKGKESDDAETRKAAICSLTQIIEKIGIANIDSKILFDVNETFYKALEDY